MSSTSSPSALVGPPPNSLVSAKRRWPRVGDFNVLEASIGQRGMGKSTHQALRALELQRATGAYVIGHSLGRRLPEQLPREMGGAQLPIEYHSTIEKLDQALRRRPHKWHVLSPKLPEEGGPPDPPTADDLMHYSMRLSKAIRDEAWLKEHPLRRLTGVPDQAKFTGLRAPPIVLILDEGIAVDAASTGESATGKNKWFLSYVYSLRHNHIALLYAIQEPTSRSWRVLESATVIHCFRLRHEWAINAMRAAGADPDQATLLRRLKPYERISLHADGMVVYYIGGTLTVVYPDEDGAIVMGVRPRRVDDEPKMLAAPPSEAGKLAPG